MAKHGDLAKELYHEMMHIEYVEEFGIRIKDTVYEFNKQGKKVNSVEEDDKEKSLLPLPTYEGLDVSQLARFLAEKWLVTFRGF